MIATEGIVCKSCGEVFCVECATDSNLCADCSKKTNESGMVLSPDPDETADAKTSQEPSAQIFGKTITESEYFLAKRHNACRWGLSMIVGIPVFLILVFTIGGLKGFIVSLFVLPAIYEGATRLFPGSRKHGSTLYKKYGKTLATEKLKKKYRK